MTMSNISVAEEPAANMAWKSNLGKKEALCCLTGRDRGAAFVTLDSVMFTVKKLLVSPWHCNLSSSIFNQVPKAKQCA